MLEEKVGQLEGKVCLAKVQVLKANQKAARLEWELLYRVVEDVKDNITFGVTANDFLATKVIELYEALATQIKGVDPNFPLDKVENVFEFLLGKKGKKAPLTTFLITSPTPIH